MEDGIKLKYVVRLINDKSMDLSLPYIGLENIQSYSGKYVELEESQQPESTTNLFYVGNVLYGKLRPYLCKAIIAPFNGQCSSELLVLKCEKIQNQYLHKIMLSHAFTAYVDSTTYGTKMPRANWSDIGKFRVCTPTLREQEHIIAYLDHKTTNIDGIITDKEKLIELLKEKRQAIISEAVTRGLDASVPMKDSGIDWIGQIPAHWKILRGKNALTLMKRPFLEDSEVVTCFRDGEVTQRSKRREGGYTFADKEIGYQGVCVGDLVIHGMDGFAGAIGISDSDGKGSPVLNVCTAKNGHSATYFMYYLRELAQQNVFLALSTGIRERSCDLRWNKIATILFPVPSVSEQEIIAEYIFKKSVDANNLISNIKKQIVLLKEYRQSVISEAVTGEIMVATPQSIEQTKQPATSYGGSNIHFKRRVLAAKILDKLCGEPTLGHVKLEKLLFLSEYCAELDMHTEYVRHAAGPYNPKALRSIDTQLQKAKWFVYDKNNRGSKYTRLTKSTAYAPYFDANFSEEQNATVEKLLELFRLLDTEHCEIVATLYGAWNDFLIDGSTPTDEQIADEVLTHWSEEKKRIDKDRWIRAIGWMRKHQIVPRGYGEKTKRRDT